MEDLELCNKIEYLLDEIMPLVGGRRIKQEKIVEEFSDSDDNYWLENKKSKILNFKTII